MKKIIFLAMSVAGLTASSFGQGTIFINNLNNTGVFGGNGGTTANPTYSSSVTQNGLIFTLDVASQAGTLGGPAGSDLIGADFSWALLGGSSASSLTAIASFTGSQISGDNANWGQLQGPGQAASIAGTTAGATVYLELEVWEGSAYSSYAAALAAGDYSGTSGVFTNPSGGGPNQPFALTGMPDILVSVPEPTTMALAGLGGLSLLFLRRKK